MSKDLKPLNSVERRELNKLIDAEFELISLSVAEMASQDLKQQEEALEAEYAHVKEAQDRVRQELKEMFRQFEDQFDDYVTRVKSESGLKIVNGHTRFATTTPEATLSMKPNYSVAEPKDLQERRQQLRNENARKLSQAQRLIQRQKLDMQKKVTLAGLTSEAAQEYVGEIPSAEEIFNKSTRELTA